MRRWLCERAQNSVKTLVPLFRSDFDRLGREKAAAECIYDPGAFFSGQIYFKHNYFITKG